MNLIDASFELMRRENDRECRKNYGFGLDEIPPMSQWEMKIRRAAIDASRSASYQKGRPTLRQRQKIEEYNRVARRYRTLADAEFQITLKEIETVVRRNRALADAEFQTTRKEIEIVVAKERAAGVYREPGIAYEVRGRAVALWIVCLLVLLLTVWPDSSLTIRPSSTTTSPSTIPNHPPSTSGPVCSTPNASPMPCSIA